VLRSVVEGRHPAHAPAAALNLAKLLKEGDDVDGAQAAYETAIQFGDPDLTPGAAFDLGVLLWLRRGDRTAAAEAFEKARASGHWDVAAEAAYNLGVVLLEMGERARGEAALREAAEAEDRHVANLVAIALARLADGWDPASAVSGPRIDERGA
jgi:tetratricopeptide (TPR) repeat protein